MMGAPNEQPAADPELAAIARAAAEVDAATAAELNPPDPNAPTVEPIDYTQEARELIDFAHASLTPLYPSLDRVYTPEVRQRIAVAGGRVLQKYGVSMADLFAQWAPEISFVIVVVPLVYPTVQAIRHDRAAASAPAKAAEDARATAQAATKGPDDPTAAEQPTGANPLERFGQ